MPKFRAVIVTVRVLETFASSPQEGAQFIRQWQEGETEDPEGGIKSVRHKMQFEEFDNDPSEVIHGRNHCLAQFLDLMQNKIEGYPNVAPMPQESGKIIHPFSLELVNGTLEVKDLPQSQGEKGDGGAPTQT